ncbi:MAG: GNAT family N-acetyltransferase [Bacillota bacterium]
MYKKVMTKNELRAFTRFPYNLYKDDAKWFPPVLGVREQDFDRRLNPPLAEVDCELYLVQGAGPAPNEVLGRIAAMVNRRYNAYQKEKTAFFGFFECVDDPIVAKSLLAAAGKFAVARGMQRIMGPIDFSTNYPCGVVIKGGHLPPTVTTPYTKPYYSRLMEACGYRKAMDYYAYTYQRSQGIPERMARLRPPLEKRYPGLVVRPLRRKDIRRDMAALGEVLNAAFADNWGFVPLSGREFEVMRQGFLSLNCLDTVLLATVDSRPAGILIAIPDINQKKIDRLRLSILGVKPEFRGRGIETLLILKLLDFFYRHGYREIDCSLILENNIPMNTFIGKEFGCPLTRVFRVYEKPCGLAGNCC